MKRNLLLFGLISAFGIVGLSGCAFDAFTKKDSVLSREASLSMQAATSLSMVGDLNSTQIKNLRKATKVEEENKTLTEEEKKKVKEILPTLDLMLSNSSSFDSVTENGEFKPVTDDETLVFDTKEIISFLGTDGKSSSYTLYYNAPKAAEEVNKAAETEKEDEEVEEEIPEEESQEIETEESIEGLAFLDETTYYPFNSKIEKEVDADESEEERTFRIITAENSYIEVKQEHEVEGNEVETEFKYTVKENGIITLEYSIEIENEDNQIELGYEIGNMEYELVKEEKDGEVIYHVEVENDETDTEALISFKKITDAETGEVSYEELVA